MEDDELKPLKDAIYSLYSEVNKQYHEISLSVPTNLSDFNSLKLAQIYHELINMLP